MSVKYKRLFIMSFQLASNLTHSSLPIYQLSQPPLLVFLSGTSDSEIDFAHPHEQSWSSKPVVWIKHAIPDVSELQAHLHRFTQQHYLPHNDHKLDMFTMLSDYLPLSLIHLSKWQFHLSTRLKLENDNFCKSKNIVYLWFNLVAHYKTSVIFNSFISMSISMATI